MWLCTTALAVACSSAHPAGQVAAVRPPSGPPVYPLTGLPATDAARQHRPALSVKIDNVGEARPQAGLNSADLVTDILVEGGLTRLMATFQSQDTGTIGPIRSARPVDADLLRELGGGIFAYSGAAPGEIAPSRQHSTALLVSNDADSRWFHRAGRHAAPHNVYSSTSRLFEAGRTLRKGLPPAPQLFSYSAAAPAGPAIRTVRLTYSPYASCAWTWDGHSYLRTQDGSPDRLDGGQRVTANDVVILSVGFHPTHIIDAAGNADPYVEVIGSGKAWVMRDGHLVAGRWVRPSYYVPMRLLDDKGAVIALHPGRTWMELQPRPFLPAFS